MWLVSADSRVGGTSDESPRVSPWVGTSHTALNLVGSVAGRSAVNECQISF